MATIKMGAIVTDINGKLGGHVFKGSNAGTKVIQTKINKSYTRAGGKGSSIIGFSATQSTILVAQTWRNLSATQRKAWATAAVNVTYINKVGERKHYNGYQYYQKINNGSQPLGGNYQADPPVNTLMSVNNGFTITSVSSPSVLTITPVGVYTSAYQIVVLATRCISAGLTPQKSDYRILSAQARTSSGAIDLSDEYNTVFGDLLEGGTVWVGLYLFNETTNQRSNILYASAVST